MKPVGTALITIRDRTTSDDVISTARGHSLLGVRTLEGMGYKVNPKTGKQAKQNAALLL